MIFPPIFKISKIIYSAVFICLQIILFFFTDESPSEDYILRHLSNMSFTARNVSQVERSQLIFNQINTSGVMPMNSDSLSTFLIEGHKFYKGETLYLIEDTKKTEFQ